MQEAEDLRQLLFIFTLLALSDISTGNAEFTLSWKATSPCSASVPTFCGGQIHKLTPQSCAAREVCTARRAVTGKRAHAREHSHAHEINTNTSATFPHVRTQKADLTRDRGTVRREPSSIQRRAPSQSFVAAVGWFGSAVRPSVRLEPHRGAGRDVASARRRGGLSFLSVASAPPAAAPLIGSDSALSSARQDAAAAAAAAQGREEGERRGAPPRQGSWDM